MNKVLLIAAVTLVAGPALAQTICPIPPMRNPRAAAGPCPRHPRGTGGGSGPGANSTCLVNGNKTTTIVVNSEDVPIAMVSDDGSAAITQRIAMGKAMISLKTKGASADGAKADFSGNGQLGRGASRRLSADGRRRRGRRHRGIGFADRRGRRSLRQGGHRQDPGPHQVAANSGIWKRRL